MAEWFRRIFRLSARPCSCDICTGREPNRSNSRFVSHGLHMWIGRDGQFHQRAKSRLID